jgi:hypothetical protein
MERVDEMFFVTHLFDAAMKRWLGGVLCIFAVL